METLKKIIWNKINLRQVNLNDAQSINKHVDFEEICFLAHIPFPQSLEDTKNFIKKLQEEIKLWKSIKFWIENKKSWEIIWMIWLDGIDLKALKLLVDIGFQRIIGENYL